MERLDFLGEVCPGAAYLFDATRGNFLWLSPRIADLLGYSPDEILALGSGAHLRLVDAEDLTKVNAHYLGIAQTGIEAATFEARFVTRAGDSRILKCHERVYARYAPPGSRVVVGMAWDATQGWRQERQLHLLADLLQAVKQAVIATDLDGRVTYWNHYAEQLYGYSADEAIGKSIFDLTVDPASRTGAEGILRDHVKPNSVWRGVFHVRHRDGHLFPARVTNSALHGENGKVAGYIGISEDISAELAAQQAIEESERRLSLFARAANDALWEWDPDTGRVWRNEVFAELVGEAVDNDGFSWWLDRVHPDDRAQTEHQVREGLSGLSHFHVKYRLRRADGEYAIVLDRAHVDRYEDGRVRRVVGAITDITPLARAEEALHEQMEHFRRVFEEGPLGIALLDREGGLVRINPQLCQMLEYSHEELTQLTFHDLTHQADLERTILGVRQLFAGEIPRLQVEKRCRCKTGRILWVSVTGTLLRSHDGVPRWMLAMIEDITERRAVEEELRVARERAEAASAAKSAFLAQVSHEIRTPMNGLLGMLALLSAAGLTPEQQQLLDTAQKAGDGLLRIINDILDLTRYHHGKLVIQTAPCSLSQLVAELQAFYRPQTEQKGLTFTVTLDPLVPPWVLADSGRLRQVLMNLLSNAFRFTSHGSVTLEVRCRNTAPLAVEFSVADTGAGIPKHALDSVFDAFSELSAETSRTIGGTGLGLAIVKQLVTLMGGVVQVQSVLGEGTRFWFTLPLEAALPPAPVASPPLTPGKPLLGRRMLLVEDNVINQKVGQALLTGMGVEVDIAASGLDAVHRWEQQHYDLVFMDCSMPVMDGFEAARRIRALGGRGAQVPIIALTALAFDEDRQRCLDAGMSDFLSKPVDRASLLQVIQQWLPPAPNRPPPALA